MRHISKNFLKNCIPVILLLCLAAAVLLAVRFTRPVSDDKRQAEISQNIQTLQKDAGRLNPDASGAVSENHIADLKKEQEKILGLKRVKNAQLLIRYTDVAIAGDSVAAAITEYGFLDKSKVFAKVGASVRSAGEIIETMEAVQPYIVFLCFGLNDAELYEEKTELFIRDYVACIEQIRQALPFAAIYICSVPSVTSEAVQKTAAYAYLPAYNDALQKMCDEQNLAFLDASFILEQQPELYDQDGIHPKKAFYPKWLTFLADAAGVDHA